MDVSKELKNTLTESSQKEKKPAWTSKTFWMSLIVALAPLVPSVSDWITINPGAFSGILGGVFAILRFVTKDKVVIK